ncbi:MAG: FAD-binding oxidoreductase [Thermoanaerobaculia bacterium]
MTRAYQSWGRYPRATHAAALLPAWTDALPDLRAIEGSVLPFGLGRSYGDACLNDGGSLIDTSRLDRFRGFDEETGTLRCESGVTLREILRLFAPRGWFLPVVPGTKDVTVGGAIANDVHGKNHHRAGTFGRFVRSFELLRSDGTMLTCSPAQNAELFSATIGGLGLTGLIVQAEIVLRTIPGPFIDQERIRFASLNDFFRVSRESDESHEYTVAWLDCLATGRRLGRGIFIRGNHAKLSGYGGSVRDQSRLNVRVESPAWLLSRPFMRAFNELYYHSQLRNEVRSTIHYESFFFPLDAIDGWNLLYGKAGFLQYQCVAPLADGERVIREVLERISRSGDASFLAVLKRFGSTASPGLLSFPRLGYTLSLDFAFRGGRTLELLDALDAVVVGAGGAIYPAKDARMAPAVFESSFARLPEFRGLVDEKFSSSFWRRVAT